MLARHVALICVFVGACACAGKTPPPASQPASRPVSASDRRPIAPEIAALCRAERGGSGSSTDGARAAAAKRLLSRINALPRRWITRGCPGNATGGRCGTYRTRFLAEAVIEATRYELLVAVARRGSASFCDNDKRIARAVGGYVRFPQLPQLREAMPLPGKATSERLRQLVDALAARAKLASQHDAPVCFRAPVDDTCLPFDKALRASRATAPR